MASNTPILEQIILDIVSNLAQVTAANGYQNNVTAVRPNPGLGNALVDGLAIVSLGTATSEDPPNMAQQWRQEILIDCCVMQSESSTTTIDTRRITMIADIAKALLATYTRGGLAIDTVQTQILFSPIDYDAHIGFVTGVFEVVYRTVYGNGYDAL
ncbi:MAG: hypothetical protein M0Z50_04730 [Planctomycetia bacterium]|nr:hypothetical protein [Planctomycetia bacterium]